MSPLDEGGQNNISPLDEGDQNHISPLDEGGQNHISPLNEGDQNHISPLNEGDQNHISPLYEGDQNHISPLDEGGQNHINFVSVQLTSIPPGKMQNQNIPLRECSGLPQPQLEDMCGSQNLHLHHNPLKTRCPNNTIYCAGRQQNVAKCSK